MLTAPVTWENRRRARAPGLHAWVEHRKGACDELSSACRERLCGRDLQPVPGHGADEYVPSMSVAAVDNSVSKMPGADPGGKPILGIFPKLEFKFFYIKYLCDQSCNHVEQLTASSHLSGLCITRRCECLLQRHTPVIAGLQNAPGRRRSPPPPTLERFPPTGAPFPPRNGGKVWWPCRRFLWVFPVECATAPGRVAAGGQGRATLRAGSVDPRRASSLGCGLMSMCSMHAAPGAGDRDASIHGAQTQPRSAIDTGVSAPITR